MVQFENMFVRQSAARRAMTSPVLVVIPTAVAMATAQWRQLDAGEDEVHDLQQSQQCLTKSIPLTYHTLFSWLFPHILRGSNAVVTCKIKHFQNICKNVLVLYFTCRLTSVKHLQNICKNALEVVTCKIKHFTTFYDHGIAAEVDSSKTFSQMFYFTCNHGLKLSNIFERWSLSYSHSSFTTTL